MKSKTLVCPEPGKFEIQNTEWQHPGPGKIQIQVHVSVVSPGTERAEILNTAGRMKYPLTPGYSVAGTVVKVGENVTRFKVGDRVASKSLGQTNGGNVEEAAAVMIPNGVSFEKAAFMTIGIVSLQGIRKARIEIGEKVLILGMGIVGQLALQFAQLNGSLQTIAVDRSDIRLDMARQCGAEHTLNASPDDWIEQLKEITGGTGPQVVMESTGIPSVIPSAIDAAAQNGRVVILGSPRGGKSQVDFNIIHQKMLNVIGALSPKNPRHETHPGYWTWLEDATCYMEIVKRNKLNLDPLITDRIASSDIETTYTNMLNGDLNQMGIVINWD